MSKEFINLDSLNTFDFKLGPSINYTPSQELPEMYFTATAPVMFGKSFFNNWQTISAPFTFNTLEGAEKERYGIMPDTNLAAIRNSENWTTQKPTLDDFWEYRKANYLLSGGAGSGFLGRDVSKFALERAKMGYWSGPYFKIQNPLIENMDQIEKDYNDYLQNINTAKQNLKANLGKDGDPVAYYNEGVPYTADGKIAWSSDGSVTIKNDGKEIPSHVVPEPMTMQQFYERNKEFIDKGSITRWMLESQAEGGYFSGNALVGTLVDTIFDNPMYASNLDDQYAKETAIQLSLAKYNSGFNIMEDGVGTIGYDIKEIIDKKEPNFDGAAWFNSLSLTKEIKESLATKGISEIDFIGTNNKNHALFVLQDKLFKTTLQEKVDSYRKDSNNFDFIAQEIIGFVADLTTTVVNDQDLAVGVLATAVSGGISAAGKLGSLSLKATGYTNKAIQLDKLFKKSQTGLKTLAAISTGELPDFLKKVHVLKKLGYIGGTGAVLNTLASFKDQNTRIAMSMTGLQTDQQFEYSVSELAMAAGVGFGFGTSLYGITQGLGKIKRVITKKDSSGIVRLETPEGKDVVSVTPTPETAATIKETVDEAIKATEVEPTIATVTPEPVKTIDLDIEGTKYKFTEEEAKLIEPTAERNTVENAYIETPEGTYEVSKLNLEEGRARAVEIKEPPVITGATKTREEDIASSAEKFSDKASIKERGKEGSLGLAPESSLFNRATGEGSVAYGVRSIEGNQVNSLNDWKRIAITKEELTALQAEKQKYLKIRKIREVTKRSLDVLKQIKESGLTKKDAAWFANQEINITKHINDLLDLEYRAIGEQHKGFAKLSEKNKEKFLELAEKHKDTKKEDFDKLINEEKNLSRSFRKTLKDYIYGKESKKEALKVKPTDSPLVKKMKENANAILSNRKTKPRSLNTKQTQKAQKAFLSVEFGKSISTEHNRLLNYFETALTEAGIEGKAFTDSVKILSAALANLKLNPAKLTKYLKTNAEKAFGATMAAAFGKEFKYGLKLDNLKLKNLTPAELAQATVRVALHELGHIYSFVLDVDQQIELYKAYSDNVDLDLLQHMTEVDRQLKAEPYGTGGFEDAYLSNVAEFFANMFDSLVYTQTVDAIAKLENNSLLTKFITPLLRYISDVAKKLVNNFSKSFFRDLDDTISEMIQTADLVAERSSTDAASIGIMSYKVQNLLPAETTSFEGLLSYRNYLETISNSVFKKAERSNSNAMFKLSDLLTELSISEDSVPNIQGKLLSELFKFSDNDLAELVTIVDHKNIKEVFSDFTENERALNILTIASYILPNRIEELISAMHLKAGSAISSQLQKFLTTKANEIVESFLEITNVSDTYKAKSIAYAIPTLFDEYLPIQDMYRNYTSILDFYNSIQNDPDLKEVIQDKIGLFRIKAPQATQTLGAGYINQFMFLDDILSNVEKTTGIVLDSNLQTMSMFMDDNQKAWISMLLDNPDIAMSTVKQLIASHDQPHNIKTPQDLLMSLSDITTEHGVIKHLLKTYYTEADAKRFSLKDIESKFNDEKFAKAVWEASQNNPTIDGFAKALADLLIDKKKKEIKKTDKIKKILIDDKTINQKLKDTKVVDKEGKPLTVYHGTSVTSGFSNFKIKPESDYKLLFGSGAYFTEDPDIASQYAKKEGTVYPVYLNITNPIDMDIPSIVYTEKDGTKSDSIFIPSLKQYNPENSSIKIVKSFFTEGKEATENKEIYKDLIKSVQKYIEQPRTNEEIYRHILDYIENYIDNGEEIASSLIYEIFKNSKYDGITHMGGGRVRVDGKRHRVWIVFDSNQVYGKYTSLELKEKQVEVKKEAVVPEPVKKEITVPEQYVSTELEGLKTVNELIEKLGVKSELRSKLVNYLKKNWSGIKTASADDIINNAIVKLLENSEELQKALDATPSNKGRTNIVFSYIVNTARGEATKQKRQQTKVSVGMVDNEGNNIDIPDAKLAAESNKPIKKEQAETLLSLIPQLTLQDKNKDTLLKYAAAKRDNPLKKDNEIAALIGVTPKELQNAKAALKKQINMVDGEIKLLNDEVRPTTPKEAVTSTAANVIIEKSNNIISGEEKPKPVSLEQARAKLEASRNIKTKVETAVSPKTTELPAAMPEVKTEVGETVMFVSGETKDDSIKAGSVLLPENKVIVDADKTEPVYVSTTKFKSTTRTLTLVLDKPDIISALEATPEERFSDIGLEKDILVSIVKESKTPETTLIDILKEQNIDLVGFMKKEKTVAVVPTKEGVVKKEATLDTTSRLPVIRKPTDESPKVDPSVIIDKPTLNPEEVPVSVDKKTGRVADAEPKVKKGKDDRVNLEDLDKFDAQMMSGESILRYSGTDPKFVKTLLLNFHKVTGELRENLGKKLEALPDQFLHFLDKVYDVYSTISNINKEKYGSRFEAINNIFWEYYDIEIAKELAIKGTPVEKLGVKTIDEIISFATEKTNQAITSYNTRYNTELPEFTPPPSPYDFEFKATNLTLRYPDKLKIKDGSNAAVSYASAKTIVDTTKDMKDLGLGVIVDLEKETLPPDEKILVDFLNELATEHTEVFRSTNFIARLFRGSEKENRNRFREALRRISGLTSFATGEGQTLRSINNLLRYLSSFAESGKVMTHQLVKSGTEAFKTWEACHHQVVRSLSTPARLNSEFARKVGDAKVGQAVELALIKSLVIDKAPLTKANVEAAILSVKPDAKPAYINDVFEITNKVREESIRRNKFILDLENKTEWIKIKDKDGNPVKPENYFPLTMDGRRVSENNKSQIVDEMVRVRTNTILNDEKLDRSIMLAMGWLWDADGNPFSYRNKEGRNQVHIGETGFDADTLSRLEAKAGNRRYAPGTDLRRIPEIGKEADVKFFSYVDPATAQVVICAIPETVKDLSPADLLRYRETVQGSTTHFAQQWKNNFGSTKPAMQVMMEELLSYKLREGNYHKYLQKPEAEDNAFLRLFGADDDVQGFAIKNLSWEETFDSKILTEILRSNPLEAYENFIMRRGFELLVQNELDRQLGTKGIRIYNLFDTASKLILKAAKGNESLEKDFKTGLRRLAQDYAEYAGRNNPINGSYGDTGDQLSRGGIALIRATSGQRWGLRSLSEAFVNFISAAPEVGVKETINNLFKTFELLLDRRMSSAQKQQLFETVFGIRSYLSEVEDRYLGVSTMSGTPSLEKTWWSRIWKSREDSWKSVAAIEKLGNLGVEIGSVRSITAFSRHVALTKFAKRNAKYILNDSAIKLLSLIQNPENKAELERLQELSATSEKADKQLAALQKKLARQAGFGGNWDHALTFQRFGLLDADKLKALKYAMEQSGTKADGLVNLIQLNNWANAYISGPDGPISKEVMTEAMSSFMYAIETQIQTDGMISESRGLNRDLSFASRSGAGKLMRSLLQWSQSFQSNVLQNLQLKKPTMLVAELAIMYSAFNYLSELLIDWLNGRDASDIKEELKDPSTVVYRMASTIPVLGPLSGIFSTILAGISEASGGTFKGFSNPITPPAFAVINAYTSKALNSAGELWRRGGEMSTLEMVAKFGDILPYNITFNNSPVAIPARFLQEMDILDQQGAFAKYLQLIQKSKNKYSKKDNINTYSNPAILKSKEVEKQLRQNREKYLQDTNKFIQDRKNLPRQPITFTNNKGVSTDLANLLEDMSNNQ